MPIPGIHHSSRRVAPDAPLIGVSTNVGSTRAFNNGRIDTTFSAPTYDGGLPITGYRVVADQDGTKLNTGATSPISVTALTSATNYSFKVQAQNAIDFGTLSASSNLVTATTVPQAPTIGSVSAGVNAVTVNWTTNSNGGSAITNFTIVSSPATTTQTATSSPYTFTGLSNGTTYQFTVTANNTNGSSVASGLSSPATPTSPPVGVVPVGVVPVGVVPVGVVPAPPTPPAPQPLPSYPGVNPGSGCFNSTTLISTPNGYVFAKDIKVGSMVHSIRFAELPVDETAYNVYSWRSASLTPVSLNISKIKAIVIKNLIQPFLININGDLVTPEHLILTKDKDVYSFKQAGDVHIGEYILKRTGDLIDDLVWEAVISNDLIEGTFNVFLFDTETDDVLFAKNHLSHNVKGL